MVCSSKIKLLIFRIISAIALIALMIFIFGLSKQTSTESADLSGGMTYKILYMLSSWFRGLSHARQFEIVDGLSFIVRKSAHFSLYFAMGVLSFLTFVTYNNLKFNIRFVISTAVCVLFSASDEIHQYFIPGRSCELTDVFIDSVGAFLSIIILTLICKKIKRLKDKVF